jgi:colanic acid/amylovoran biosynthesis glycosyltransferase
MKIAFIVPEFPSLSQTFVLSQIVGLLDRGHDVEIFAGNAGDEGKLHPDVMKYSLLGQTTYLPEIPNGRLERTVKGLMYALGSFTKHPRSVLRALNVFRFGRLAASFTLVWRIIPFLGRGPFDVIHCHFGPCGMIGIQCILTGALRGRVVTTFHGFDLTSFLRRNGNRIYEDLFEHCDVCMPISNHWRAKLIEMGCDPKKIVVHHMGVNTKGFQGFRTESRKGENVRVLSVARLVDKKGIQFGIEALSKVVEDYPNVEYLIAGDGPLRPQLEQSVKDLGLDGKVRFLGWMNQEEVTGLMMNSEILVAPSITGPDGDQEGIPVVLMEALAMGLPVVSTHHSGIPELIIDGATGLLAPERDSNALADKIMQLIRSDRLVSELRSNGRAYVQENFDIEKLNSGLEGIYRQLLSS